MTEQAAGCDSTSRCPSCCQRASVLWAYDELMVAALNGQPLETDVIDRMPPYAARIAVAVCLGAGGVLQHGTAEQFDLAADAAGRRDARATGWWREALGMQPTEVIPQPARPSAYRTPQLRRNMAKR